MQSLGETTIFKALNSDGGVQKKIAKILTESKELSIVNLEAPLAILKTNVRLRGREKVLKMVEDGRIKMIMSPEGAQLPKSLPFILTGTQKGIVGVVILDTFGRQDKRTGAVQIPPMQLYTLLEGCALAIKVMENPRYIMNNSDLLHYGAQIYSQMCTKILNKKYALNTNPIKMNRLLYLTAKFFLVNIIGLDADGQQTKNIALKCCKGPNEMDLTMVDSELDKDAFNDFASFIREILNVPSIEKTVPGLSTSRYIEKFMMQYDASALLSIENINYFNYNIIGVVLAAYVNNQYALEDICDKVGAKYYAKLSEMLIR